MSILRRYDPNGRPVFITLVTYKRQLILLDLILPLMTSYRHSRNSGVPVPAWVVMPDHIHAIVKPGDMSLSASIHRFKRKFSALCYQRNRRGRIWQHRFWDHIIRDQEDFNRHVDYVHFNPQKHTLTTELKDWKWSSLHRWAASGLYQPDWGEVENASAAKYGE